MYSIFKTFVLSLLMIAQVHFAYAQNASILPPAKTTFLDNNGKPLTSGTVEFFIPSTGTHKTTWQDSAATVPNTNPVVLDAAGRAIILGNGSYRQVVKDRLSNIIWDQNTASTGSGGGGGSSTGDGNAVGTIQQYSGFVAPSNYAFTYGQEVSRTTYAALFSTITLTQSINCTSGNATLTTIADTTQLNIGTAVEAACVPAGATIISKTVNSVTLSANATVTTTVSAVFFPWGNGNGLTTFNIPDFRGAYLPGRNNMGGAASANLAAPFYTDPNALGGKGGAQSKTLLVSNMPSHIHSNNLADAGHFHVAFHVSDGTAGGADVTVGGGSHTITDKTATASSNLTLTNIAAGGGIAVSATVAAGGSGYTAGTQLLTVSGGTCTTQPQFNITTSAGAITAPVLVTAGECSVTPANPAATTGGGGTGGTLNIIYSAVPFTTLPPSKTINYIIKILPDIFPSTPGVTSIQGMTGAINCVGTAIVCSGNNITVNIPSTGVSSIGGMVGAIGCGTGINCSAGVISTPSTYITPASFGAVCDGVTNDAVALQNAINAAAGKTLMLPQATCLTNSTLNGVSNIAITGGGNNVSILKSTANPAFAITNKTNISITDIQILGTNSVASWGSSPVGPIQLVQNAGSVAGGTNFEFSNIKFVGWNPTYWVQINTSGSTFTLTGITMRNNVFTSAASSVPTDGDPANNTNALIVLISNTAGNGRIENVVIDNNQMEATGVCFGILNYANTYKFQYTNNKILNAGASSTSHCTNALAATNVYGIAIYDLNSDGNPASNGLVSGNFILAPRASGIYWVGDGVSFLLGNNSSQSAITNNLIQSQTQSDAFPRGAIVVSLTTNMSVIGNTLYGNQNGIHVLGQSGGNVSVLSNHCSSGAAGGRCLVLGAGVNGSSNTDHRIIRNNYFEADVAVVYSSATGARFNFVDLSGNYIFGTTSSITIGSNFFSGTASVTGNNVGGGATSFSGITGNLLLANNPGLAFTVATLPAAINTSNVFVTDGTPASSPCTGASTGAQSFRQNGAWKCF